MNDASDVVGILLAAGRGTRFSPDGSRNKLLADLHGRPVCVAAAQTLLEALPQVAAATSPATPEVAAALARAEGPVRAGKPRARCEVLVCPRTVEGMGGTLAQAVAQLSAARHAAGLPMPAWCVLPADMPQIAADTVRAVVDAWRQLPAADRAHAALAPAHAGERGHPVLLGPGWTGQLIALQGDAGARKLIAPHLRLVDVDDPGCLFDVDTPQALANAAAGRSLAAD